MRTFVIFTDGAYDFHRGVGASAYVVLDPSTKKDLYKWYRGCGESTQNRCEVVAVIESLQVIPDGSLVHIMTDSTYTITVLGNEKKRYTKNADIIEQYRKLKKHKHLKVSFHFIKGHSGNKWNELCDNLCKRGKDEYWRENRNYKSEDDDWTQFL